MAQAVKISNQEKSSAAGRAGHERKAPQPAAPEIGLLLDTQAIQVPGHARPVDLLRLQQRYGNQVVQRMLHGSGPDAGLVDENRELSDDLAAEIRREAMNGGETLPAYLQREMGAHLGRDLSMVRVHTGPQADRISGKIHAQAFTLGRDVFFRQGAYQPQNPEGQATLAHELAHVVQQGGQAPEGRPLRLGERGDSFEQQAEQSAQEKAPGEGGAVLSAATIAAGTVQRTPPMSQTIPDVVRSGLNTFSGFAGFYGGSIKSPLFYDNVSDENKQKAGEWGAWGNIAKAMSASIDIGEGMAKYQKPGGGWKLAKGLTGLASSGFGLASNLPSAAGQHTYHSDETTNWLGGIGGGLNILSGLSGTISSYKSLKNSSPEESAGMKMGHKIGIAQGINTALGGLGGIASSLGFKKIGSGIGLLSSLAGTVISAATPFIKYGKHSTQPAIENQNPAEDLSEKVEFHDEGPDKGVLPAQAPAAQIPDLAHKDIVAEAPPLSPGPVPDLAHTGIAAEAPPLPPVPAPGNGTSEPAGPQGGEKFWMDLLKAGK